MNRGVMRGRPVFVFAVWLAVVVSAGSAPVATALESGKPAPDFTLPSTTGEKVSLSQFRGQRLVLIEFYGAAFAPT